MRTSYWRFAYDTSQLSEILKSGDLCFPKLGGMPSAKNNSVGKVIADLKVGNFILLANFDRTSEIGIVRGVGRIVSLGNGESRVEWRKPVPSWSLTPDARGGVQQWLNEAVFCFDAEPARRYKLQALTKKLFHLS